MAGKDDVECRIAEVLAHDLGEKIAEVGRDGEVSALIEVTGRKPGLPVVVWRCRFSQLSAGVWSPGRPVSI